VSTTPRPTANPDPTQAQKAEKALRDPIWTFVSIIVGAVVAIAAVYLGWYLQRSTKQLSYGIIANAPLLGVPTEAWLQHHSIGIIFDGKSVKSVSIVAVKVFNSGNMPITREDVDTPITIKFKTGDELLSADVVNATPRSLNPSLSINGSSVTLDKTLMNAGDSVSIQLLLASKAEDPTVEGRIVGVSHIEKVDMAKRDAGQSPSQPPLMPVFWAATLAPISSAVA
jgi:hypothetical protein